MSHEISFAHNFFLISMIILKIFAAHSSTTGMFCAKFRNDWATNKQIMDKRDFVTFESKMIFGRISCIAITWGFLYIFNGLMQDCSISIAHTLEILQSCTKPLFFPCHCYTLCYLVQYHTVLWEDHTIFEISWQTKKTNRHLEYELPINRISTGMRLIFAIFMIFIWLWVN